jgi:hypothetical protein
LGKLAILPPGTVIAVQAPWGRGKTDVLARAAAATWRPGAAPAALAPRALWLNPWQYGTPDLLSPLVLALLERISPARRGSSSALLTAAETVIRAGLTFGLKAVAVTTGTRLLDVAAEPVHELLGGLFEARRQEGAVRPDADPAAAMAARFRELVGAWLADHASAGATRVLICVDDLDRCLPDRQVAFLEALRFLLSAGAAASFLVALDPALARQAVGRHYGVEAADLDRYLEKMLDLRVNLPALGPEALDRLVAQHLAEPAAEQLQSGLGLPPEAVRRAAPRAWCVPELRNPRTVRRVFDRLALLAQDAAGRAVTLDGPGDAQLVLAWLGLIERWPDVRAALQDAGEDFATRFVELHRHVLEGQPAGGAEAVVARLPCGRRAPDLAAVLRSLEAAAVPGSSLSPERQIGPRLYELDQQLVAAGL